MKPTKIDHRQGRLFETRLSKLLSPRKPLYCMAELIDWEGIESDLPKELFDTNGRPGKPVRLMIGLLMLQQLSGSSDEGTIEMWVENPYWQYFCGYDYLQWDEPADPTTLIKWRQRLGKENLELVLSYTIKAAREVGLIKKSSLSQVISDTTVMEKNVSYPMDSKLYNRSRERLVKLAQKHKIKLRQSYGRIGKRTLRRVSGYRHARQMNRAKREEKKLKTYLQRIVRELYRKLQDQELKTVFKEELEKAERLLAQQKNSKNKLYSIHEPEVECVCKGKSHKKYEFGCKAALVVTHKEGLVLSASAEHGVPYDGHTLSSALEKAERISGVKIEKAFVDKGYKGHGVTDKQIIISGQKKGMTKHLKKQLKRRQAIEPHIGHMKSEGKLNRNYLAGKIGDQLNAILVGIGHNLRMLFRMFKEPDRMLA